MYFRSSTRPLSAVVPEGTHAVNAVEYGIRLVTSSDRVRVPSQRCFPSIRGCVNNGAGSLRRSDRDASGIIG